ncbi:Cutinase transcription factor 1 beta [Pseudocercospora fuligena]|uniref:Cutinase transcription factor 1 beta n=1 Tax=Pseudocercospora fuligena TaxID=685502 RepID=A0A8H6RGH9_9PEZI|nr:Cutinase transcription factor 1 beta [Pseudocercospora fuligena]
MHTEDGLMSPEGATARSKLKQRRSRKACVHCHTRKIRCNVLESGTPCSNCVDASTACVIRRRKNQRRDSTPPNEGHQIILDQSHSWRVPTPVTAAWTNNTVQRPTAPPRVQSDTTIQTGNGVHNAYSLENQSHSSGSPPTGDSRLWPDLQPGQFNWDQNIIEASSASCDFSHLTDLDDIFTFTGNSFLPALPPQTNDFPPISTYGQPGLHTTPLLPGPVSPLNGGHIPPRRSSAVHIPGLNPRDQEYLRIEGCFDLPPPHVLRVMMRMYFKMVHPNLPIVAEDQFWALWSGDEFRVGEFSFLLLRAMIFAATSYTELETLSSLGFVSKREARNTHYRQAKLLFDFGIEREAIASAQACLLLSYNAPNYNLLRLNTYWITNAIRFARIARADSYYRMKDPVKSKMLKRIWWGVILRDRILSLGLRRSIQVPLENDWDTEKHILQAEDFQSELGNSPMHDTETQLRIFEMLGTICRLAQCLTHTSRILYKHERLDDRLEYASRSLPTLVSDIQRSLESLRLWHEQAIRAFPFPISLDDAHETICVYANMMFSYHASAVFGLNTYLILLREVFPSTKSMFSLEEAREALEIANNDVSRRTQELVQVRLVKYLPISASAVLALPLILQAINVAAARGSGMESVEIRRLDVFTKTLKSQQQNFDGSDFCADVLANIVAYAQDDSKFVTSMTAWKSDNKDTNGHASGGPPQGKIKLDWGNLVFKRPRLFLRMVLYIDHAFCTGGPPQEEDFPAELQRGAV